MVLKSNLTHIALQAPKFASEALLQTAADIVDITKQLAPVDTGALKQSYGAEPVSSTHVLVGSDLDYSVYQEFGTENMPAQPHLVPAFAQGEAIFRKRLQEAANKVINSK